MSLTLAEHLEDHVDSTSVARVLEALADVCSMKADHIRENWQDASLARAWELSGRECEKAAVRVRRILPAQ